MYLATKTVYRVFEPWQVTARRTARSNSEQYRSRPVGLGPRGIVRNKAEDSFGLMLSAMM